MLNVFRSACVFVALFAIAPASNALIYNFEVHGLFTLLSSTGEFIVNTDAQSNMFDGNRTDIYGTLTYDTTYGIGSATLLPFEFAGFNNMQIANFDIKAVGDGMSGPGPLMLVNMLFDWGGYTDVPVSFGWDATGFLKALTYSPAAGSTISGNWLNGTIPLGSALPASDNTNPSGPILSYPIGPTPLAMSTLNTTTIAGAGLNSLPSGSLPFIVDTTVDATNGDIGIGGSPMITGPFQGANFNLDIGHVGTMVLMSVEPSPVPLPAASWLFGSGVLALIGVAKRKALA